MDTGQHSPNTPDVRRWQIELNGKKVELAAASITVGEYHLAVAPDPNILKCKVVVYPIKEDGEPDFTKELFYKKVDGAADDVEEILDTYKNRLEMGIRPEDLDADERPPTLSSLNDIASHSRQD